MNLSWKHRARHDLCVTGRLLRCQEVSSSTKIMLFIDTCVNSFETCLLRIHGVRCVSGGGTSGMSDQLRKCHPLCLWIVFCSLFEAFSWRVWFCLFEHNFEDYRVFITELALTENNEFKLVSFMAWTACMRCRVFESVSCNWKMYLLEEFVIDLFMHWVAYAVEKGPSANVSPRVFCSSWAET